MSESKYKLLYIEDDPEWQNNIKNELGEDCEITNCSSIEDVVSALRSGKTFDIAAVDLTIDRAGDEWEIKTPEDLINLLKDENIGVVVLSGVETIVASQIEQKYGVKVLDKSEINDFNEIIAYALLDLSRG